MKCYFCKTTGTKKGVMLETVGIVVEQSVDPDKGNKVMLICPSCKTEAITFWKHHYDLGLLE